MRSKSYWAISILLLLTIVFNFTACGESTPILSNSYSFENDMQGWIARGIDLLNGDEPEPWSIERSQDMSWEGGSAAKLYLENWNDAGKIWIQRSFDLEPEQSYKVNIEYVFASSDFGNFNLWKIITGVAAEPPQVYSDLIYQGNTGNGASSDVGYSWLEKSYDFTAETDKDGMLYVFIGVWGTWETPRTYYLDSINITICMTT